MVGEIEIGLQGTFTATVREADTAVALESGDVEVLATPRLVAWLEAAAVAALASALSGPRTSVGTHLSIDHRAPSAVGAEIECQAVVTSVEGRTVMFDVVAHQVDPRSRGPIASGRHTRVMVDRERFLASVASD